MRVVGMEVTLQGLVVARMSRVGLKVEGRVVGMEATLQGWEVVGMGCAMVGFLMVGI